MKIEINNNRKIFAIQEEFSGEFPNLNIMFYGKPSKPGGSPSTKMVTSSAKFLAECRAIHNSGHISISPQMMVRDLKQNFRDVFGLAIEIFPKLSSDIHGKTHAVDEISLDKLNGRAMPHSTF